MSPIYVVVTNPLSRLEVILHSSPLPLPLPLPLPITLTLTRIAQPLQPAESLGRDGLSGHLGLLGLGLGLGLIQHVRAPGQAALRLRYVRHAGGRYA